MMPALQPTRRTPPVASMAASLAAALTAALMAVVVLAGCSGEPVADPPAEVGTGQAPDPSQGPSEVAPSRTPTTPRSTVTAPSVDPELPLAGRVVVLDPGHQLGNAHFPAQTRALVDAGGFTKACNTTGTSTDGGYPEATFVWEVATVVERLLRRLGARVLLTRSSNSAAAWGPCVD